MVSPWLRSRILYVAALLLVFASGCELYGYECEGDADCALGACVLGICQAIDCQGLALCRKRCVDIQSDRQNCGACGALCRGETQCLKGRCLCPTSRMLCGEACVDLQVDEANCGSCGAACAPGQSCTKGKCICPSARVVCGEACVDLQSDKMHCGSCTKACHSDQACVRGACTCPKGTTLCEGRCVDLQKDTSHCGRCGEVCPGSDGAAGVCCAGTCRVAFDTCNNADDDCDGLIDEDCPTNYCPPSSEGETQPCQIEGRKGICGRGTRTCSKGTWTTCVGGQAASSERCNGIDDDCDGLIDEEVKGCVSTLTRPILLEGPARDSGLFYPRHIAVSPRGVVYMTYSYQYFIHRLRLDGYLEIFAGASTREGAVDGPKGVGRFLSPLGMFLSRSGRMYVVDRVNHTLRAVEPNGTIKTIAGIPGTNGARDGDASRATLNSPVGVVEDSRGDLFVISSAGRRLRKISFREGKVTVSTVAGNWSRGAVDGKGTDAAFMSPQYITIDTQDNLYIIDDEYLLRKVTPQGEVSTLLGRSARGYKDGPMEIARFNKLAGVAVDAKGQLYIAENDPFGRIRKIDVNGMVSTLVGKDGQTRGFRDGRAGESGEGPILSKIEDIALDGRQRLYILDANNHALRVFSLKTRELKTLIGVPANGRSSLPAHEVQPFSPQGMTAVEGSIYLVQSLRHQIMKFSFSSDGIRQEHVLGTTNGGNNGSFDQARLNQPHALAHCPSFPLDMGGELFLVDTANHRIRQLVRDDRMITTLTGGTVGATNGTFKDSRFRNPKGIVCRGGKIYISDTENHSIRVIENDGSVNKVAGTGPGGAGKVDGKGAGASFDQPQGITLDLQGQLYVADSGNHCIRKVTPDGTVTTFAGIGHASHKDGNNLNAQMSSPTDIVLSKGIFYVADRDNRVIRQIAKGQVTTLIGTPRKIGYRLGPPDQVMLNAPQRLLWFEGKLYISDSQNDTIFVYTP